MASSWVGYFFPNYFYLEGFLLVLLKTRQLGPVPPKFPPTGSPACIMIVDFNIYCDQMVSQHWWFWWFRWFRNIVGFDGFATLMVLMVSQHDGFDGFATLKVLINRSDISPHPHWCQWQYLSTGTTQTQFLLKNKCSHWKCVKNLDGLFVLVSCW